MLPCGFLRSEPVRKARTCTEKGLPGPHLTFLVLSTFKDEFGSSSSHLVTMRIVIDYTIESERQKEETPMT